MIFGYNSIRVKGRFLSSLVFLSASSFLLDAFLARFLDRMGAQ